MSDVAAAVEPQDEPLPQTAPEVAPPTAPPLAATPDPALADPEAELAALMDQAIREGANIEDLERLMEEHRYGIAIGDEGAELYEEYEATEAEIAEGEAAPGPVRISRGRFLSILERVGGKLSEAKKYANWLLGKRQKLLADFADNEALVKANIKQQQDWLKGKQRRLERHLSWMDWLLRGLTLEAGEKKIELPAGDLAWEKKQKETEWDEVAAVRFVLRHAFAAAKRVLEETHDRAAADEAIRATLAGLLTPKRDPVKKLLTKREDGTHGYVSEDGEVVTVIEAVEVGETPVAPGTTKAQGWVKAGESYVFWVKGG